MKYDNGFNEIRLKFYMLDLLRMMEVFKKAGNMYYYNELRWFVNELAKCDKRIGIIDFARVLPRLKLKEKKPWELEQILRNQ